MKHLTLTLLSAGLVVAVLAAPVQAQRRGGGGYGGYRGGWSGGYGGYGGYRGGWYGGTGLYSSPYWGGGYYRPYAYNYGGYNQPYYGNYYVTPAVPYYSYSPAYTVPYDSTSMMYTAPSDATAAAGQTQNYQSFYNAPAANSSQATLRVQLPQADARVWVDNRQTEQQGTDRLFVTPALQAGREYSYTIRATWRENGRDVSREKTVTFTPGQQLAVNFLDTQDRAITDVPPTQPGTRPVRPAQGGAAPAEITPAARPPAPNPGDDLRPDRSNTGAPSPGSSPPPPPPPPKR